jgi:hypothetical protein
MKRFLPIFLIVLSFSVESALSQRRDNSFKIMTTMTGLGAAYEFNPSGILYAEGGITTSFNTYRFNLQSKLALYQRENFKIKFGVEGAFVVGNFDVGGIYIDYNRFNNWMFMPMLSIEGKVLGIQIPIFVDRSLNYAFPIVGISLNVSKDNPAKRVKKEKSKKDFDREIKEREKLRKKAEEEEDL